jgi:adenylate kinase family enzyme
MKRVLIIGSGGAGKSTLARTLGERLGIEVIHLDVHFWKPGHRWTFSRTIADVAPEAWGGTPG